jgi:hypothetical protein
VLVLTEDALLDRGSLRFSVSEQIGIGASKRVTPEMFKANPGRYWEDLHLVPKGTRLRCAKLQRHYNTSAGWDYRLYAEILDGEFKGKVVPVPSAMGSGEKKGTLCLSPHMGIEPETPDPAFRFGKDEAMNVAMQEALKRGWEDSEAHVSTRFYHDEHYTWLVYLKRLPITSQTNATVWVSSAGKVERFIEHPATSER